MIVHKINVINELKKHGYSTYRIRSEKIFNETQLQKFRTNGTITFDALDKVCRLTNLQPGDILEFVEDNEHEKDEG